MAFYESVVIARPELTETQIDIHNNKLYLDPYQTVWITNK